MAALNQDAAEKPANFFKKFFAVRSSDFSIFFPSTFFVKSLTGLGGTLVELYKDLAFGHVPLSAADPARMLDSLRCSPLLTGYRGSQPVDIQQFKTIIMRVNQLLLDFPAIREMDINPLIFDRSRGEFFAVDARIKLS